MYRKSADTPKTDVWCKQGLNNNPNLDPIQNNCKYGYVLPDRCRYNSVTGCDCGAYPPLQRRKDQV